MWRLAIRLLNGNSERQSKDTDIDDEGNGTLVFNFVVQFKKEMPEILNERKS